MAAQSGSYNEVVPNTDNASLKSGHSASASLSAESAAAASEQMHTSHIRVNRPVYTQMEFKEKYNFMTEDESKNVMQKLCGLVRKRCTPSGPRVKKLLLSLFPFIGIMSQYSLRRDLFSDIIAGLTVGIMHIPQGQYFYPNFLACLHVH